MGLTLDVSALSSPQLLKTQILQAISFAKIFKNQESKELTRKEDDQGTRTCEGYRSGASVHNETENKTLQCNILIVFSIAT